MHASNSLSTLSNHQGKVIKQLKNASIKIAIVNNVPDLVVKNTKSKFKSSDSNSKQKNCESGIVPKLKFTSSPVQKSANFDKRRDKNSEVPIEKIIKPDTLQTKELSEGLVTKQYSKFKSVCPKTYICKFCCRRFYTEEHLQQHTKIHGNKTSHICYLCNHQTASFSALMTHYLKHSGPKGNKLEKIYAKSKADYTNIQFNISSRPKPLFRCSKCKLSFNVKSKYESHTCPASLVKNVYSCAYCGRVSSTVEEYRNCVQSHTETPFICPHCKSKFQRKKNLDKHLEDCKPDLKLNEEYKCETCMVFVCKSKKELEMHSESCERDPSSYACEICNSEFHEKKSYDSHLLQCKPLNKDKPIDIKVETLPRKRRKYVKRKVKYTCSICDAPFFLKAEYKKHEKNCVTNIPYDTNENASKTCLKCNNLIEIGKFSEHLKICVAANKILEKKTVIAMDENVCLDQKISSQSKPNIAIKDRACSSSTDNLTEEKSPILRTNTDKNQLKIQRKAKVIDDSHATRRSTRLVRRKSTFSDDDEVKKKKRKPIKIIIPKKPKVMLKPKFRRGKHSNDVNNSFLCNICDFSFCSKSTLLRHKRMHSGNPWYTCQFCGKFFFRKDVYIRHEINVHRDNTKTVFCCCYCKICFKDSLSLKDHVSDEHKDSAFLPIRSRFARKRGSDVVNIKQESEDMEMDGMSDLIKTESIEKKSTTDFLSSFSTETSFKCSLCSLTFETAAETAIHLNCHNKDYTTSENIELKNSPEKTPLVLNSKDASLCESTFSLPNSTESCLDKFKDKLENVNNASSVELISDSNMIVAPNSDTLKCLLCSNEFPNKTLLEKHDKITHKIVDWYQCLVCSASGPKQDMQEHMFSHMFKVGTFVVNSNRRNFDGILSCLQFDEPGKGKDICKEKQDELNQNNLTSEITDLVSEEELPPLKEFGICLCMETKCEQKLEKLPDLKETDLDNEKMTMNLQSGPDAFKSATDEINLSKKCEMGIAKCHTDSNAVVASIDATSISSSDALKVTKQENMHLSLGSFSEKNETKLKKMNSSDISSLEGKEANTNEIGSSDDSPSEAEEDKSMESHSSIILSSEDEEAKSNEIHSSSEEESAKISEKYSSNITSLDEKVEKGKADISSSEEDEEARDEEMHSSDVSSSEKEEARDEEMDSSDASSSSEEEEIRDEEMHSSDASSSEEEKETKSEEVHLSDILSQDTKEPNSEYINPCNVSFSKQNEVKDEGMHFSDISLSEEKEAKSEEIISTEDSCSEENSRNGEELQLSDISYSKEKEANKGETHSSNVSFLKQQGTRSGEMHSSNVSFLEQKETKSSEMHSSNVSFLEQKETKSSEMYSSNVSFLKQQGRKSGEMHSSNVSFLKQQEIKSGEMHSSDISSEENTRNCEGMHLSNISHSKEIEVKRGEMHSSDFSFLEEKGTKGEEIHLSDISLSSQAKEQFSSYQSGECISDYQTESFSQLRYLLQKPSKIDSEKITIYPSSHIETTGYSPETSNPFVKYVSTIKNQSSAETSLISDNKYNFNLPKQNNAFNNEIKYGLQISPNINQSTCLKLDINQSRSEVSGSLATSLLNQKPLDKTENLFKPCQPHSTILDFSDLIQHSFENSSPCEENIFSYSTPAKAVDFLSDVSTREEVHTPDCSDMENYASSAFNSSVKCNKCNAQFESDIELAKHKCLPVKPPQYDDINLYKPKSTVQSLHYVENQNKVPCVMHTSQEKINIPTLYKPAESFVCGKVTADVELEKFRKSLPHQNVHIPPQSGTRCNKCHGTFSDIGELMKHSLTCLKPLFLINSQTSDCVSSTAGTLHPLLYKEHNAIFSDFSINSSLPDNTVVTEQSCQNFDELKRSFDS